MKKLILKKMTDNERNVEFFPDKIKYNALTKFRKDIVKIPSYIIEEVLKKKLRMEIYHKGKLEADYSWGALTDNIKKIETKEYNGKFRNENIKYRLNHIQI
jgi:hypothetical protein